MRNLLVNISYNGARYHGYQVQKHQPTITSAVQDAIEIVLRKREGIVGCSRTDSGVHANEYYFNMKTENNIPCDRFVYAMNNALPDDIIVLSCKDVSLDFHARYHCKNKEYIYKIYNAKARNPFLSELAWNYENKIDEKNLNSVAQSFVGTYDFSAFCSLPKDTEKNKVRTVHYINVYRENDYVYVKICANNFLYNMVRIIVGTLIDVNEGKIKGEDIPTIIENKNREAAGKTAPAQGLYLNHIEY